MIERQSKTEQKDVVPNVDFQQKFYAKLSTIPFLTPYFRKEEGVHFKNIGITEVTIKAPSVIFTLEEEKYELWLEDLKEVNLEWPHNDIYKKLSHFLNVNNLPKHKIVGDSYIIQDRENKIYLFFDHKETGSVIHGMRETGGRKRIELLADLMKRYDIEKICGNFSDIDFLEAGAESLQAQSILNSDIIGKIREMEFWNHYRQKYPTMTNTQFLRFLTAINTKKPDETYDQVAQRVIAMDKTEDATKKSNKFDKSIP